MAANCNYHRIVRRALLVALGIAASAPAFADVTVQQQTSMTVSGLAIDTTSVERTSADKQRRDTATHCHGFLSLVCGNVQNAEILRLDRQLEWQLQTKKQLYTERAFPTAEERALAQQQLQAELAQMKNCPMPQASNTAQSGPDTSHCQLSAPTIDVKQSDEHASVAGHDTRKTSVVLSQTCTDSQTGDICKIDYGFDMWLATDQIPGADERRAFTQKYLTAQGLDPNNPQVQGVMQQYMAPYADALKQLQTQASNIQGYPMRSTFYVAIGGPHCGRATQAAQQQTATNNQPAHGLGLRSLAGNAIGGRLSGLFSHHGVDANTSADAGQAGANAVAASTDAASGAASSSTAGPQAPSSVTAQPSQMVQLMSFTTETTSIDTSSIAADQFELPAGWKLQPAQPAKGDRQFSCPTTGH